MPCYHVNLLGHRGIVCTGRERRRKCKACGNLTATANLRECDWKTGQGKTCDLLICTRCASAPAPGKDLCPEHAKAWDNDPRRFRLDSK